MTRYSVTVTAYDPNPDYDQEKADRAGVRSNWNAPYAEPKERSRDVITVDLTPEEFAAIKRAVLEVKL